MDSFTVVALAGNILQFVVFARNVYKQVKEAQSSALGIVVKDQELRGSLEDVLENVVVATNSFNANRLTIAERKIRQVGERCQKLARELQEAIDRKGVKSKSHFLKAVAKVVGRGQQSDDVDKKIAELEKLQQSLLEHLLVYISGRQSKIEGAILRLLEENRNLKMTCVDDIEQLRGEIAASIQSSQPQDPQDICSQIFKWTERVYSLRKEHAILESLRFDGMLHRQEDIISAHKDTLKWVYDPKLHFQHWLENGEGIYWITGDPGSGKSTLTKYVSSHATTDEALLKWAEPKPLVKASFYFWYSGTVLQKSQEGLLRSLLFEILRQCPSSIHAACASRWEGNKNQPWNRDELLKTLENLVLDPNAPKFCFFIDGLDEYYGNAGAHEEKDAGGHVKEIIQVIKTLSKLPGIKLCVSSRPWHAFEQEFGQIENHKLYVHNENRDDIRSYIHDQFGRSNIHLNGTKSTEDQERLRELVEEIVLDSQGVFLWVYLVIENLLQGLRNYDRLTELRKRLRNTPKTLNLMFERMLESVGEGYQEQAAQILQIAQCAVEPMYVIVYSFINDGGPSALQTEIKEWSEVECVKKSQEAEAMIKARCPDFIKIRTPRTLPQKAQEMTEHHVDFIHRTVRDFLALEETQLLLKQKMKKPFDPEEFICHSLLKVIKAASIAQDSWPLAAIYEDELWQLLDDITFYTKKLEEGKGVAQVALLDELQRVMARGCRPGGAINVDGDSFVGLMVQKDLRLYVKEKLPHALKAPGVPLLYRALFPRKSRMCPDRLPNPEMVDLLLSQGARPTQLGPQQVPIWQTYLCEAYLVHLKSNGQVSQTVKDNQKSIIKCFLQHGADPKARCVPNKEPSSTGYMDILKMVEEYFSPEERRRMEYIVHERRPSSSWGLPRWLCWA